MLMTEISNIYVLPARWNKRSTVLKDVGRVPCSRTYFLFFFFLSPERGRDNRANNWLRNSCVIKSISNARYRLRSLHHNIMPIIVIANPNIEHRKFERQICLPERNMICLHAKQISAVFPFFKLVSYLTDGKYAIGRVRKFESLAAR